MRNFTLILCLIAIIITGLPVLPTSLWWIRIFDFPRLQIAVLCLVSLILLIIFIRKGYQKLILCSLVLLCLAYHAYLIIPYTPVYPVQVKGYESKKQNAFTILESNVKMDNQEVKSFLEVVNNANPDILIITEPGTWWDDHTKHLAKQFPYSIKKPLNNTYGMIMYSKLPLKGEEINFLVKGDIPSFFTTVTLPGKQDFDLYILHPEPPKPGNSTENRDTEILIVGEKIKTSGRPAIVVGDLNDVGWSPTSKLFRRYSEMLDPRVGRGLFNTYSVLVPLFRYPLDHFFISKHFSFIKLEKLSPIGSDHYPVLIKLNLDGKPNANMPPNADEEDKAEVNETLSER